MNLKIDFFKKDKLVKKDNYQMNSDRYWRMILLGVLVLMIGSFIFGFILFRKTSDNLGTGLTLGSENAVVVKKERIEKVLEVFSLRKSKSMEITTYGSGVVDPSL